MTWQDDPEFWDAKITKVQPRPSDNDDLYGWEIQLDNGFWFGVTHLNVAILVHALHGRHRTLTITRTVRLNPRKIPLSGFSARA